jgi:acyl transferase domain-containing protein
MSMYARQGCFADGVAYFDAGAFRLPRAEAAALDPQQRLLLEAVAGALADAGNASGQAISAFTGDRLHEAMSA